MFKEDSLAPSPADTGRTREILLLLLVLLMAIAANLPHDFLEPYGLKPGYLVALLGFLVVIALFLYLRFFFFLLYVLLAIGANLPAQWAEALGISQLPLLLTLIAMVGLSLLNYAVKFLPTGIEGPKELPKQSAEGTRALMSAIERGNLVQARQILAMGIDPNLPGEAGSTPLMLAAQLGYADMVDALLAVGANPALTNADGHTARDLAFRKGFASIVKRLNPAT